MRMSKLGGVSFIRVKTKTHFTTTNEFNIQVHEVKVCHKLFKKEMLNTYEAAQVSMKNIRY